MKISVIADSHGNLLALQAVLRDIGRLHPDLVVNLGDLVSGPFDPAGSADAQMALGAATLAGNHERQVLAGATGASDAFARPRLADRHLAWLHTLPPTLSLLDGDLFACHGSPAGGDLDYLLEDVSAGHAALAPDETIRRKLAGIGHARVVLCGHTHIARIVTAGDVLVVNPGSVGMPSFRDDRPCPHVMDAGSPHARYATLTRAPQGWAATLHAVPYDHQAAARQAERNGRPEVAFAVRTGRSP